MRYILRFLLEEDGPTAVEYAIMLALLVMVCIVAIGNVGSQTAELMDPGGQLTGALRSGGS